MPPRRTKRSINSSALNATGQGRNEDVSHLPVSGATTEANSASENERIENSISFAAGDDRTANSLTEKHAEAATLWLRRADQLFLGFLVFSLLALLIAFRWRLAAGGRVEIEITNQRPREFFYAIAINRASWVEWAQLDGIGEKLARRIVEDRSQRGPFKSIDDVARVRGLGRKLIEKLRPYLRYDDEVKELQ